MHLTELSGFAAGHATERYYIYMFSLDVDGASDSLLHHLPVQSLQRMGVDRHLLRFTAIWLTRRTSRVRLGTSAGTSYRQSYKISQGLPQGGVLPPLPWLVIFNNVQPYTTAMSGQGA